MAGVERSQVLLCAGAACISSGALRVKEALLREMQRNGLEGEVRLIETGCGGPCNLGPLAIIYPEGVFYQRLTPEDAREIVEEHLLKGRVVERLLYQPPQEERKKFLREIAFFEKQKKDCSSKLWSRRSPEHRRVHRPGWVPCSGQGAHRDDP